MPLFQGRMERPPWDTPHPLWDCLPGFSWVAEDNEVVTLDWGRKSAVFQCCPFKLGNNQYGGSQRATRSPGRKTGTGPLISVPTSATHTPLPMWKHTRQVNTQIHMVAALMGRRVKTQPCRRRGLVPASSRAARALHSLNGWNGQLLIKQTHKKKPPQGRINPQRWQPPSRIYPELIVRAAQHTASMQRVPSPIDWCYVLKWFEMIPWAPTWWSWIAVVNYDVISQTRHSACSCRTVGSCKKF